MAFEDRYGNKLTCSSEEAAIAYREGVDHLLGATYGAVEAFTRAAKADPRFAVAQAGLARALMMAGDMKSAKTAIASAVDNLASCGDREKMHVQVFASLFSGKAAQARSLAETHLLTYPRDALIAQLCAGVFGLIAFSGCSGTEAQIRGFSSWLLPHYGDDWWMRGIHAVSLCESGQPDKALELMELSLESNPRNANGAHFKAHALYEMNQPEIGLSYLNKWLTDYDQRAQLHGHLSWHVALWAMGLGETDTMWSTVDKNVGPHGSMGLAINTATDTAAIYFRAEMAGIEVAPERWQKLSSYVAEKFPNPGQSFVDIHAALSHAMAGNSTELAKFLDHPKGFAGDLVHSCAETWRLIVQQQWQQALAALTPVMSQHARLGGSRAQRDMLEFTYLNILMKLGKAQEAQRFIQTRRAVFADSVPLASWQN